MDERDERTALHEAKHAIVALAFGVYCERVDLIITPFHGHTGVCTTIGAFRNNFEAMTYYSAGYCDADNPDFLRSRDREDALRYMLPGFNFDEVLRLAANEARKICASNIAAVVTLAERLKRQAD